jgi:hypothetical protein
MNFHIISGSNLKFFTSIIISIHSSLVDLGHKEKNIKDSELIIGIKNFPDSIKKEKGKKYWLIQTEQINHNPEGIHKAYNFKPDRILGFDKSNKLEEYLVIGYHPKLEISVYNSSSSSITLLGAQTPRRIEYQSPVKNKFSFIREWNYHKRISVLKNSLINLNIHSYHNDNFTEFERIIPMIANKCFFISEPMDCPFKNIVFFERKNYDETIEKYLKNEKLRKKICEQIYNDYVTNYDMRNIMGRLLK